MWQEQGFSNLAFGYSTAGYGNYTTVIITLLAGILHSYETVHEFDQLENVGIWIDVTNDGVFSAAELV